MDSYQKYLESAVRYLGRRPRSEKEVRDNLRKKHASPDLIEQVVVRLKKERFVNDEDFARWWVEQRVRFKPKGKQLLKIELLQKGIPKDIIEKVTSIDLPEIQDDVDTAKKLVKKKSEKYKGLPREKLYQKLGGFLARRGFDWETIKKAIDANYKKE